MGCSLQATNPPNLLQNRWLWSVFISQGHISKTVPQIFFIFFGNARNFHLNKKITGICGLYHSYLISYWSRDYRKKRSNVFWAKTKGLWWCSFFRTKIKLGHLLLEIKKITLFFILFIICLFVFMIPATNREFNDDSENIYFWITWEKVTLFIWLSRYLKINLNYYYW